MSYFPRLFTKTRLPRIQPFSFPSTSQKCFHVHRYFHKLPQEIESAISFKSFNEPITTRVQISETKEGEEEREFLCEEEPHVLTPEQGFGFNPLKLGDRLQSNKFKNRTYQIVRKLGYGSNASIWLARFSDDSTTENYYLALKVLTVNLTAGIVDHKYWELDSNILITIANPEHPGYQHCVPLRDRLISKSYHGPHFTFAFDVLGSDLGSLQSTQPNYVFSSHVTKRIIKQVLLALDYLHRECNLVHTDVQPANIMACLNVSNMTITNYLKKNPAAIYEPQIEPELSPDPIITVMSQPLPDFNLDPSLDNIVVKLADYGEAFPIQKIEIGDICQPVRLRAPEVVLGHPWSTPIDIWSVGCLVFEFLTGSSLFGLPQSPNIDVSSAHLQRIIENIDSFPPNFLANCSRRSEYFSDEGELLDVRAWFPQPLEDCLAVYKHVRNEDIAPAAAFIRKCLTIDPSLRPSASELLQDEWLNGV